MKRQSTEVWTVTIVAGSAGSWGSAAGVGSSARFAGPGACNIAIDSTGNLYVADYYNHIIRKITPDSNVITIAGSAGVTRMV